MNIKGVEIDIGAIQKVKAFAELKKMGIFSHLDTQAEDDANKELFEAVQPKKATDKEGK